VQAGVLPFRAGSVAPVPAPLPAARAALRLSSHPPLRIARQRQPQAQYPDRSRAAASAGARASRQLSRRRRSRSRATDLRVPAPRRSDARHQHLRSCSAHPRTAGFDGALMIQIAVVNRSCPTPFVSPMPSLTPVARFCKTAPGCPSRSGKVLVRRATLDTDLALFGPATV